MKRNIILRKILIISIVLGFTFSTRAQSSDIPEVFRGCCKSITACADYAVNIARGAYPVNGLRYSEYPEGCDNFDPIAMGLIDPWEVYSTMMEEAMDSAMAEEAQREWHESFEERPDISDRVIKP